MSTHWSDSQVRFITRVVRSHDRDLFAERSHLGHVRIMRKAYRAVAYDMGDGNNLIYNEDSPQFIFALTDNWTANGKPRDWGALVVLERLKKHDSWNNEALLAELEKEEEQAEAVKEKDFKNSNEAWLADNHKKFKESFKDVRIANFDKSDRRRRKFDARMELKS